MNPEDTGLITSNFPPRGVKRKSRLGSTSTALHTPHLTATVPRLRTKPAVQAPACRVRGRGWNPAAWPATTRRGSQAERPVSPPLFHL